MDRSRPVEPPGRDTEPKPHPTSNRPPRRANQHRRAIRCRSSYRAAHYRAMRWRCRYHAMSQHRGPQRRFLLHRHGSAD
jgi:hypothetical protein